MCENHMITKSKPIHASDFVNSILYFLSLELVLGVNLCSRVRVFSHSQNAEKSIQLTQQNFIHFFSFLCICFGLSVYMLKNEYQFVCGYKKKRKKLQQNRFSNESIKAKNPWFMWLLLHQNQKYKIQRFAKTSFQCNTFGFRFFNSTRFLLLLLLFRLQWENT